MKEKSHSAILKILTHAEKSIYYASLLPAWREDDKSVEAIVFNLAQIGELVQFVDDDVKNKYSQVNWPAMKGLRNRIIHDYDYVRPLIIKNIVNQDLPNLISSLLHILDIES